MNNMAYEKLGTYCDVISGYAFKSTDWQDDGVPVVKIGNISNGYDIILDEQTQYVDSSFCDKLDKKFLLEKGDILVSLTGSHINQPNSMVGRSCRNYTDRLYLLNQRAGKVIPFATVDKDYLYYLFSTKAIKYDIAYRAYGGANQVNVSPTDIKNIKWLFPEISVQRKIAGVLTKYDKLIHNNNKRIKVLEQMAENLYKEWFVRFRFPGYENAKFENSVPKGWEYVKIGDAFETSSGGTPSRSHPKYYENGTIGWIKTGELLDSLIINTEEHITEEGLKNSAAKLIPVGALLCSMYAGVGKLGITTKEITCSQATCVFMPKSYVSNLYMFQFLKLNKKYLENISFGAAQQNISQVVINRIKFLAPPMELIKSYDESVKEIYKVIYNILLQNQNLIKQRDMLLPRLMSGKLEV